MRRLEGAAAAGKDAGAPMPKMRKLIVPLILAAALVVAYVQRSTPPQPSARPSAEQHAGNSVANAFASHARDVEVEGSGTVVAVLRDDTQGSRHQRFLLRVDDTTVLVAHNIDLAPRVPLQKGDRLSFRGQYEWNEKGGVIHWTHRDPSGRHEAGWLKRGGETFE